MLTKGEHMADDSGQRADTWRTKCVEARPKRTQGGQIWRTRFGKADSRQAETRRTHTRHKADTWRTRFGAAAKADSQRTHGGQAPGTRQSISRPTFFIPKRERHRKLFGENRPSDLRMTGINRGTPKWTREAKSWSFILCLLGATGCWLQSDSDNVMIYIPEKKNLGVMYNSQVIATFCLKI